VTSTPVLTLSRLAAARLRTRWQPWVAVVVAVGISLALVTAAEVVQSATDEAGLQLSVARAGPAALVEVSTDSLTDQASYGAFQSGLDRPVARGAGAALA